MISLWTPSLNGARINRLGPRADRPL